MPREKPYSGAGAGLDRQERPRVPLEKTNVGAVAADRDVDGQRPLPRRGPKRLKTSTFFRFRPAPASLTRQ